MPLRQIMFDLRRPRTVEAGFGAVPIRPILPSSAALLPAAALLCGLAAAVGRHARPRPDDP